MGLWREDDRIGGLGTQVGRRLRSSIRGLMIVIAAVGLLAWFVRQLDWGRSSSLNAMLVVNAIFPILGTAWSISKIDMERAEKHTLPIIMLVCSLFAAPLGPVLIVTRLVDFD